VLSRNDVAHNRHACLARNIGDHVMKLHVHVIERLLHPLDLSCAFFDERLSMTRIGPQLSDSGSRPEARSKQAKRMQFLQPLAIQDVALASGHVASVSCVHE
jgi:hypothetical protein